jgi:hypothetical protein
MGCISYFFYFISSPASGGFPPSSSQLTDPNIIPNLTGVPALDILSHYDTYIFEQQDILDEVNNEYNANPHSVIEHMYS